LIVLLAVWCAALRRVLCATAPRTHGTLRPQILAGRPKVTLKGYLRKRSRRETWQKRWFEANGQYLTYYKTEHDDDVLAFMDMFQVGGVAGRWVRVVCVCVHVCVCVFL
jgi:hypothetical protein